MYCKNCGKTVNEGDKFCSGCGTKLEPEEEFVPAFRQQTEPEPARKTEKPRRHILTEDFNWDLDGYPTENKRTEEVDFNWDSVLEEKQRGVFPREPRRGEEDEQEAQKEEDEIRALEESIFADMGSLESAGEGGTRVAARNSADKSEKIDKFYTFHKKNEEYQALLDQECERIKNGQTVSAVDETAVSGLEQSDSADRADAEAFAAEILEKLNIREPSSGGRSPGVQSMDGQEDPLFKTADFAVPQEKEEPAEKPRKRIHEEFDWTLPGDRLSQQLDSMIAAAEQGLYGVKRQPEYVGVALAQTPKCYIADQIAQGSGDSQTASRPAQAGGGKSAESGTAAGGKSAKEEKSPDFPPSAEEGKTEDKPKLTFDDVFGADSDDTDEKKGKGLGLLKAVAVILSILVVIELAAIGIQHFAPDSKAAQLINKGYSAIFSLFDGGDGKADAEDEETEPADSQASEISALIEEKSSLNKNIAQIAENQKLTFEDGKNYGFEDFGNTYTFADKPWYEDEDGNSVTYGGEIIGTVIQYYSARLDKINGKNEAVLDFIDDTSELYPEIEELSGEDGVEYGINRLEIGEIRAGGAGFYVMVSVAGVDSESSEKTETQVIYLEPINKSMKIVDIKII